MTALKVWETEDAVLIIWGTHSPSAAYGAAFDWYAENSEMPDGLAGEILNVDMTGNGLKWADPAVLDLDEAVWPVHLMSRTPVEGWTPYMVVAW